MVIVPIVVAKHSTIIRSTNSRIDVSQNVLHDLAVICLPNFFLQYCALSFPFQPVRRINSLGDFQLFGLPSHDSIIHRWVFRVHTWFTNNYRVVGHGPTGVFRFRPGVRRLPAGELPSDSPLPISLIRWVIIQRSEYLFIATQEMSEHPIFACLPSYAMVAGRASAMAREPRYAVWPTGSPAHLLIAAGAEFARLRRT